MTALPEAAYYLLFYAFMLLIAVVGMALHVIPSDVGIAMISFVLGHGAGLFAPPPPTTSQGVSQNTSTQETGVKTE